MNFAALGKNKSGKIKTKKNDKKNGRQITRQTTNKQSVKFLAASILAALVLSGYAPAQTQAAGLNSLSKASWAAPQTSPDLLSLVTSRNIPGSFTTNESVYADSNYIYLASFQGQLFVLNRDKTANFPLVQTINVGVALTAVRGDSQFIYVTATDGMLRVYSNQVPLQLVNSRQVAPIGLRSLATVGNKLYVSQEQATMAADQNHLYLSQLNEGELAFELDKTSLQTTRTYGQNFEANTTVVFDRNTGSRVGGITNPPNVFGSQSQVALYSDGTRLGQTTPGCCGAGIKLSSASTLSELQTISRYWTNTISTKSTALVGGTELGTVDLFDLSQTPSPLVQSLDLRQLTGHTGGEDIEIRGLWMDSTDKLVFAASSWGNDESRGPDLPSLFILQLGGDAKAVLSVALAATSPSFGYVTRGTPNVHFTDIRLCASKANVTVTRVTIKSDSEIATTSFANLTLKNGATILGTASALRQTEQGATVTIRLNNPLIVPVNTCGQIDIYSDVTLAAKANLRLGLASLVFMQSLVKVSGPLPVYGNYRFAQ